MIEDPGLLLFLLIVLVGARLNDRLSDQRRARESGARKRRF